jgi:5-methylcytosine-specific restriction endonuclease McrA
VNVKALAGVGSCERNVMKALLNELGRLSATYGTFELERAVKEFFKQDRLGTKVRRKPIPKSWLQDAYAKQSSRCARCNVAMEFSEVTGDHKIPLSQGGKHNRHNIAALHGSCNSSKSNKLPMAESKASGRLVTEILR